MRYYRILNLKWYLTLCVLVITSQLHAQFLITSPTYTYTQNFGTSVISASGTNITSGTANLTGWSYDAALTGELTVTAAAPTNTGGRYSYVPTASTNRKIGSRPSGSTGDVEYGILFRNTSGQTIQSFSVSYTGFQISQGGNTNAVINRLTVDYIVSASPIAITATGGTAMPSLTFSQTQFVTTQNTSSQGQGYPASTGSGVNSGCVSVAASIPDNSYLLLRWTDLDDTQNDPHLAIDDVEVIFFTNQTVSNNSACSFLPVELLDFNVVNNASGNEVNWKVAQEDNISNYILERSENGIDFSELGMVNLTGDKNSTKTYNFLDPLPGKEITYYRLSTLEKNGGRKIYKIISLENKVTEWSGKVYQNREELIVKFGNAIPENAQMDIRNMAGLLLMETPVKESFNRISTRHLPEGIYLVRIFNSHKAENFKIIISTTN